MSANKLPNELLRECFAHIEYQNKHWKNDIKSFRLVSKRFYAEASPFLIAKATVSFNKESLQNLETLATHPIFSKYITQVNIDVTYYDKLLAQGRHALHRFAEDNATRLYQNLEMMDRGMGRGRDRDSANARAVRDAFRIVTKWEAISGLDYPADGSSPNSEQKVLIEAWHEYVKLFDEQEEVVNNGEGARKVVSYLEKFTGLRRVVVEDYTRHWGTYSNFRQARDYPMLFTDAGLRERCLQPSPWKGTFRTALDTELPVHLLSSLFTSLSQTNIRLKEFEIKVTAPANMSNINFTSNQLEAVKTTVSKSEKLFLRIANWARKSSLAENNDRPASELAGLCALTSAFFSSPKLTEMELSLDDYPVFGEIPKISASDLLTLPLPSPKVEKIYLRNVPFTTTSLQTLVSSLPKLKRLNFNAPFLLDGKWVHALDILHQLAANKTLVHVELHGPQGAEFGNWLSWVKNGVEQREIERWIMGEREGEGNPLAGWVPEYGQGHGL
ncbi:hypothetical protein BDV96DRAFT_38009 [Lophiotrema nucula]|uniref:F-box domain-containing protein n=1 Tax=Lophiotrema nucula TaxID=690887 RepID=A0A6A5ZCG3_9PLEO|nr:hypothetical protein BDV96DRAFT_38009 [Lophiotrema nucula]